MTAIDLPPVIRISQGDGFLITLEREREMTKDYAFDNALPAQLQRLRTLEELFDAGTFRHLETLGVNETHRCLEIGAGGGSVAEWLSERAGSVLATDLDTRYLSERPNLEIRVHDVLGNDLPQREFDLVHLRMVLAWVPDRAEALRRIAAALKPGGVLLAEEMDFGSVAPAPRMEHGELLMRALTAHHDVLTEQSGFDPHYGRKLTGDMEAAGFARVQGEGRSTMWRCGGPGGRIWELTLTQLREAMIEAGVMRAEEVDAAIALCRDGLDSLSPVLFAAWGYASAGAGSAATAG
jgi:SAM-dependent methyltransferase